MIDNLDLSHKQPWIKLSNCFEGTESLVLFNLIEKQNQTSLLCVLDDSRSMAHLVKAFNFFCPDITPLIFPAWDCPPYDRQSPGRDITAQRASILGKLADRLKQSEKSKKAQAPLVVFTTAKALIQKVPPKEVFTGRYKQIKVGDEISMEALSAFLVQAGFLRVDTVTQEGEYALRGGIIDIFPQSQENPVRLDFFGEKLESLRLFDALSQRTIGPLKSFDIGPAQELFITVQTQANFRRSYRELFGIPKLDDPLSESVKSGQYHPGIEHYLPLFYQGMSPLTDYLPQGATVVFSDATWQAIKQAYEMVEDYYDARLGALENKKYSNSLTPLKPIPVEMFRLSPEKLKDVFGTYRVFEMSSFNLAPQDNVVEAGLKHIKSLASKSLDLDGLNAFERLKQIVKVKGKQKIVVAAMSKGSQERLYDLIHEAGIMPVHKVSNIQDILSGGKAGVFLACLPLEQGYSHEGITVYTEQDILGYALANPKKPKKRKIDIISELSALSPGALVVHDHNGIGRYDGLETIVAGGAPHDCLRIVYAGGDKFFLPVESMNLISRYGEGEGRVFLDKLGGTAWQARKALVKKRILELAGKLLKLAASRLLHKTQPVDFSLEDYDRFCAQAGFVETEDQGLAINDVIGDLQSGKIMDRLICGDVGFGKTEVALRAAFVMAMSGRQVALLVPTTLLARQHYLNFQIRFKGFPLNIGMLSRFATPAQVKETKEKMITGEMDIVIGTHALIAKTLSFKDLGLAIVDEEQHFGVTQKERLKSMTTDVHVLTLTATPIPRTLQMALSGVRDLSIIATPPVDRLSVRTFVTQEDPIALREALMREKSRGGQTYYVCPRLKDLPKVEKFLNEIVPEVKVRKAHGRLAPATLEKTMDAFIQGEFDVLLSTNIVESGLDIPTANTIIIYRADMFGLAQLYQLRGRVGRGRLRGYCYLTMRSQHLLTTTARKRFEVMQTLDSLGAGFSLASYDMDIRGAGNLLGDEQSGQIKEVGVELYQHMLEETIASLQTGPLEDKEQKNWTPSIRLGMAVLLPESYIHDIDTRLALYRRLSDVDDKKALDALAVEMVDRFGRLPQEAKNLLDTIIVKQLCLQAGVEKVIGGEKGLSLTFHNNVYKNPEALLRWIRDESNAKMSKNQSVVIYWQNQNQQEQMTIAKRIIYRFAQMAKA